MAKWTENVTKTAAKLMSRVTPKYAVSFEGEGRHYDVYQTTAEGKTRVASFSRGGGEIWGEMRLDSGERQFMFRLKYGAATVKEAKLYMILALSVATPAEFLAWVAEQRAAKTYREGVGSFIPTKLGFADYDEFSHAMMDHTRPGWRVRVAQMEADFQARQAQKAA
jgi:hypothetical protein